MVYAYFFLAYSIAKTAIINFTRQNSLHFANLFGELDELEHIYIFIDEIFYKNVI